MESIEITLFDNIDSALAKWANKLDIPVKYILSLDEHKLDQLPETIFDQVDKVTGLNILSDLKERYHQYDELDLAMIYYMMRNKTTDSEQILSTINQFFVQMSIRKLPDVNSLLETYNVWFQTYTQLIEYNNQVLEDIIKCHRYLSSIDQPLERSPIGLNKGGFTFTASFDSPFDLFDRSMLSYQIPFIGYNDPVNKYYKVFTGSNPANKIYYDQTIRLVDDPNTIYMTIWIRTTEKDKLINDNYIQAKIDLTTKIFITTERYKKYSDRDVIISAIRQTFPKMIIHQLRDIKTSGSLTIYNISYDYITLFEYILLDPYMSKFFYINEKYNPATNKNVTIHFRTINQLHHITQLSDVEYIKHYSSLSFSISSQVIINTNIKIQSSTGDITDQFIDQNRSVINLNFTSDSSTIIESFINIFVRLLKPYSLQRLTVLDQYQRQIPEITKMVDKDKIRTNHERSKKASMPKNRLEQMKQYSPDLIVPGFGRECQHQPIIVTPEEAEEWKAKTFQHEGKSVHFQVMPFPMNPTKDQPSWLFLCPGEQGIFGKESLTNNKFPGVKSNNLHNKEKYPFIPCCYREDQTTKQKSGLNTYLKLNQPQQIKTEPKIHGDHIYSSNKVLPPNRFGKLPPFIDDLLITQLDHDTILNKYGVISSSNSLIHCLLLAIHTKEYEELTDKDDYVTKFRRYLSSTNVAVVRQELYKYTEDQIKIFINTTDTFFDSLYYIHLLEEVLGIDLFIFKPLSKMDNNVFQLEVPNHMLISIKNPRPDRSTVILFKNYGTKSEVIDYPQYELIVKRHSNNPYLYDNESIYLLLYDKYIKMSSIVRWSFDRRYDLVGRINLNSHINYLDLFPNITEQFIDIYGKARGFIFLVQGNKVIVMVPPTEPLNVSLTIEAYPEVDADTILQIFRNRPTFVNRNDDGKIIGLWYNILDIEKGLFFPTLPSTLQDYYPEGPHIPQPTSINKSARINQLKETIDIILRLVLWIFIRFIGDTKQSVEYFINHYTITMKQLNKTHNPDSSKIYNFNNLEIRQLISQQRLNQSLDDDMKYLTNHVPSLVQYIPKRKSYSFILYSDKLRDGISFFINEFYKTHVETVIDLSTVINFKPKLQVQPNVELFDSLNELIRWNDNRSMLQQSIIATHLDISNKNRFDPYTFSYDNVFYLIQNVIGGDIERAINVGFYWYRDHINYGYRSKTYDDLFPDYVIYQLSESQTLIVATRHISIEGSNFIQLLDYGNNYFAAMLPLQ